MKRSHHVRTVAAAAAALFALLWIVPQGHASDEVTVSDLQAVARSLGFLENLRTDDGIAIGIVYAPEQAAAGALAAQVAERLGAIPGPKEAKFRPVVISTGSLGQIQDGLGVVFLMPGASEHAGEILEAIRRRHLVSISTDAACLDRKCCVLLIRTEHRVDIVLDSALADAVGARFTPVFTMMVKRK